MLRILCFLSFLVAYLNPTSSVLATEAANPFPQFPPLFHTNPSRTGISKKCTQKDLCTCVQGGIDVINLHFLDHGTKPRFNLTISNQLLKWNPCTGFAARGTNGVAVTVRSINQGVSILGFAKDATFGIWNGFYAISYTRSMKDSSRIVLKCNANTEAKISGFSFDPQTNTMNVVYTGPCSSKPAPKSLSNGSIILIVFFVLVISYLMIGLLVNTYVRKFDGLERIPNFEFWKGLPPLVKDGCVFVCRRRKGYESV